MLDVRGVEGTVAPSRQAELERGGAAVLALAGPRPYTRPMRAHVQLDDPSFAEAIGREIAFLRDSGALGRSSKIRDLFDYLVDRSRNGVPPREVEISQDVFGKVSQTSDDGAGRVYIHRLRRRLEEIYAGRPDAELRISLPLGEYRLVAELPDVGGEAEQVVPEAAPAAPPLSAVRRFGWRSLLVAGLCGALVAILAVALVAPWPGPVWREAARARRSPVWAPMFANGRSVVVAAGDQYLFAERRPGAASVRLIRDPAIRSREDLDDYLLAHPAEAGTYADLGLADVPTTVPRAQLYLSPLLLAAPSVRTLPASQLPAAAMLSQNIVYLGLSGGLGPVRAPVSAGSRFAIDDEGITDRRTGRVYRSGRGGSDMSSPHRQYGLLSIFYGKEGNRYVVLAGGSDMGLVGLVETVGDAGRLDALVRRAGASDAIEALYQIDSQGPGVLAVRLVATNRRDPGRIWAP